MSDKATFFRCNDGESKVNVSCSSVICGQQLRARESCTAVMLRNIFLKVSFMVLMGLSFSSDHLVAKESLGPFFQQHCISCHGPEKEKGGLRIDQLSGSLNDLESLEHLQNILDEITIGAMPPEDEPRPSDEELALAVKLLTEHLKEASEKHRSGGGRAVRRLTKIEYANTVYDLLGVHINAEELPDDNSIGDFDTNAESLYTTDLYFENYLAVARDAVSRFIESRSEEPGAKKMPSVKVKGNKIPLSTQGKLPPAGHLKVNFAFWKSSPKSKFTLTGDFGRLKYDVTGSKKKPQRIERFFYNEGLELWGRVPDLSVGDVNYVQVVSPQPYDFFKSFVSDGKGRAPSDTKAAAVIEKFVKLINRGHAVDSRLLNGLKELFLAERKRGLPFWEAIVEPMALSMCTIEAMFHFENKDLRKNSRFVSAVELANRLSYFLWRSCPDAELSKLAQSGKIYDSNIRNQQIERMMKDEKFDRFIRDFSSQWLELERQELIAVDDNLFGDFNDLIKGAVKEETVQFMSYVIKNDVPLGNLIDSDFVVINNHLAKHYGLPKVQGDEFRPVRLPPESRRGGLLTQAGILMQTGTGERTSIVERGVFISKKILGFEPPPPPPLVDELPSDLQSLKRLTGAELVKKHASATQCASCHSKIDPLGIGLEEFDAVGLYRTKDIRLNPDFDKQGKAARKKLENLTFEVDLEINGRMFNGKTFKGAEGLKKELLQNQHRLAKSYIEAIFTMANGRKAGVTEKAVVTDIISQASATHYPARSIIKAIVESEGFKTN